jgi:hypothetical protein
MTMPRQSDDPAREWTTIATGQPVERHGVTALEVRRVAGLQGQLPASGWPRWANAAATASDLVRLTRPAINTGVIRREKMFWEVAAQAGLRTVAVNWWTSWPARDEDGIVLTERAVLRLDGGGALAAEMAPASLYERIRPRWAELSARAAALAGEALRPAPAVGPDRGAPQDQRGAAEWSPPVAAALREAALVDAQQLTLFAEVVSPDLDLAAVYLPGLDILGTKLRTVATEKASTAVLVESADAVRGYYRWLSAQIEGHAGLRGPMGEAVRPQSGGADLVLIGHPGRSAVQSPAVLSYWPHWARLPGPPTPFEERAKTGSLFDVAPTVLSRLGIPLSRELHGQPLWLATAMSMAQGGSAPPPASPTAVETYGRRTADRGRARGDAVLDEEMRERLRSLGYVQ